MPVRPLDALTPGQAPQPAQSVVSPRARTSDVRSTATVPQGPPAGWVGGSSHTARRSTASAVVDLLTLGRVTAPKTVTPPNDLDALERRIDTLRRQPGVQVVDLGKVSGTPLTAIHFGATDPSDPPRLRVLVTGGVHGNEACGPAAALILIERLLAHPELARAVELTIVPLVNPAGYAAVTRDNAAGLDLNRTFDAFKEPVEVRLVRRILKTQRFDLAIDLHRANDSRSGFFGIHLDSQEVLKQAMAEFRKNHPVMTEQAAPYILQAPGVYESSNDGTLKGAAHDAGSRWALTLEAPGALPYRDQATGLADLTCDVMAAALGKR